MESIFRSKTIELINSGEPFDLEFVTADRKRGTGGELMVVKGWMRLREDLPENTAPINHKPTVNFKKDANNHKNKTFKIFNPANRLAHPITVHYRLMQTLNQKHITNG